MLAGKAAEAKKRWADAAALYTRAIAADPCDRGAWSKRAQMYLQLDNPLLAWGDAIHVSMCWSPPGIETMLQIAMAAEALGVYNFALLAYGGALREAAKATDAAMTLRVAMHMRVIEEAKEKEDAEAAAAISAAMEASKGDASVSDLHARRIRSRWGTGKVQSAGAYRSYAGGPRDPAVSSAFFESLLATNSIPFRVAVKGARLAPLKVATGAPLIKLAAVSGAGMGLFAAMDIPAGALVHGEMPLLAVTLGSACYHCTLPLPRTAVKCSGGCDRRYCSAGCESAARAAYHAPLCSMADGKAVARLEKFAAAGISTSSRFCLVMWKMLGCALTTAASTGKALVSPPDAPPFCHMARGNDYSAPSVPNPTVAWCAEPFMSVWSLMHELLGGTKEGLAGAPALSMAWVRDSFDVLSTNTVCLQSASLAAGAVPVGLALMGIGTLFNHSCDPNTQYVSSMDTAGSAMCFITARRVRAGEELTIAYCNTDAPLDERTDRLQAQYGFTCSCAKCVAERAAK